MTPRKSGLAIRDRVRIALVVGRASETDERRVDDASPIHRRTPQKPVDENSVIHPTLALAVVVLLSTAPTSGSIILTGRMMLHPSTLRSEKSRWMKASSSTLRSA